MQKPFNFLVGCVLIVIAFNTFLGSNIFASALPEGKLGTPVGSLLQTVLEGTFALVSSLGAFAILKMTTLLSYLYNQVAPMFESKEQQQAAIVSKNGEMPKEMVDDLSRLLIQSAIDGDKQMTVVIAHKLAGKNYLVQSNPMNEFPK